MMQHIIQKQGRRPKLDRQQHKLRIFCYTSSWNSHNCFFGLLFVGICVLQMIMLYHHSALSSMNFSPHMGVLSSSPLSLRSSDEFRNDVDGNSCRCVECAKDAKCGGLWKANHFPAKTSTSQQARILIAKKYIHIVVAHCKGDLDWIRDDYIVGFEDSIASFHVISKCNTTVNGAPEDATIEYYSTNVGRCDHSYAYYITTVLPQKLAQVAGNDEYAAADDSIVVFLKDTRNLHQAGGQWNSFESISALASSTSHGFGCGLAAANIDVPIERLTKEKAVGPKRKLTEQEEIEVYDKRMKRQIERQRKKEAMALMTPEEVELDRREKDAKFQRYKRSIKYQRNHVTLSVSAYHDIHTLSEYTMKVYARDTESYKGLDNDADDQFKSRFENLGAFYNFLNRTASRNSGSKGPTSNVTSIVVDHDAIALDGYDTSAVTISNTTSVVLPDVVQVCYGGYFAAGVSNIKQQDMSVWNRIEDSLRRGSNIEEGHLMERSWAYLLSKPLHITEVRGIQRNSQSVYFRQNHTTNIIDTQWYGCYRGAFLRRRAPTYYYYLCYYYECIIFSVGVVVFVRFRRHQSFTLS